MIDDSVKLAILAFISRESGWPANSAEVRNLVDTILRRSGGDAQLALVIAVETVFAVNARRQGGDS